MSESTSILAKAIKIYNNAHPDDTIKLEYGTKYTKPSPTASKEEKDAYSSGINNDEQIDADYKKLTSDANIGEQLAYLRVRMSVRNTNYLNEVITKNVDFISLIEQVVHVGSNNHAYYDDFLQNKLDLGEEENNNYGILYRLKQMSSVEDIDEPSHINTESEHAYACVYDTIVNCKAPSSSNPKLSLVAEGISIIYKKSIFGTNPVLAVWKNTSSESYKKLLINLLPEKEIQEKDVHYYSDDCGISICYDDTVEFDKPLDDQVDKLKFVNNRGVPDGGRPIIMTAGLNTDTKSLIILVAIHGPNIPNLFKYGEHEKGPSKQLKNQFGNEIDALFDKVRTSISKFIDNGINSIDNKDRFVNIEKVEVYLGGDFNDSRGLILKSLIETDNGFSFKFSLNGYTPTSAVKFSGYTDLTKPENVNTPTEAIKQTQGRYKSIFSCCANGDSLIDQKRVDGNGLNRQGNGVFDKIHLYELSTFSPNMKKLEFVDPMNFGYNGDYALYGTNNGASSQQYMMIDMNPKLKVDKLVYPSDHLPVISSTEPKPFQISGGRRRRYSRRALKSKTRKGLPRTSRRKRRAYSYRKV